MEGVGGSGLGGVVGVGDPPHERTTGNIPTRGRVRQRLIFITVVTPVRYVRNLYCTA